MLYKPTAQQIPVTTTKASPMQAAPQETKYFEKHEFLPDIILSPHITPQLAQQVSTSTQTSKQHIIQPVYIQQPSVLRHVYHQRTLQPEIMYVILVYHIHVL